MQWRAHVTSIGLTIAAAGALAYAYLDRGSVTESEKKAREGSVFGAWRREALTRIVVDRGGEHMVIERSKDDAGDAEWWMRAPLAERADDETCDRLASAFELASAVRKVAEDVHVPGLDAPRAHGEIDMGSVTYRFALGGDAPTPAGAAYLHVEGGGVEGGATVVVGRELVTELLQASDTYRSRSFVPYVSVQLAALEIKGEKDLRLERGDDVSFKLLPSGLRASRAKIDDVWGALGEMRAEAFVSDAVAEPLVVSPRLTITMTPSAARGASSTTPGSIRVGGECPGHAEDVVVVRDAPTHLAACAPKGILSGLETPADALVDTHLFAAHADEVAEVRLEGLASGGMALELARKEGGWRERAPESRDLTEDEASAATALVAAIASAEGADPHEDDGAFEAKQRVTLRRAESGKTEGGVAEIVELGPPDAAGDVIARRAFDGARLHVGAAVARKLTPRGVALRGADVWQPSIEGVPVSAITTRCEGVDQTVVHESGAWTMRSPAGFAADNASVLDVIDAVTRARADAWVADGDDGRFGIDGACSIALTMAGDGGERVARIDLGKAGEGGVYAKTNAFAGVFVAPEALRDRAHTWLIDLHGLTPANLAEVTLTRDGKRLVFSGDAGADEATGAVMAAVTVLRADSVVHLGPAKEGEGLAHPSLVIDTKGEGDGGTPKGGRIVLGAETADAKGRFARVDGVDATFSIDKERVKALFERF